MKLTCVLLAMALTFGGSSLWGPAAGRSLAVRPQRAKAAPRARRKAEAALAVKGRAVYEANCARCHGADGAGRTPLGEMLETPDMTQPAWKKKRSAAQMEASVSRGLGQMPPFARSLGREDIKAVIFYVRTLGK
jgi:mono/diheme cytochrome c family protein